MFRLAFAQYLLYRKIDGYYILKKTGFFKYEYVVQHGTQNDVIDFIVKNEASIIAPTYKDMKIFASKSLSHYGGLYKCHIERTMELDKPYDYGTFEDFITEFTKVQLSENGWKREKQFPESFFSNNAKVHASLIMFDDIYMIMKTELDFIKFSEWSKENSISVDYSGNKVIKW